MNRLHLASLALLLACSAQAQDVLEPVPQMGRYMP